MSIFRLYQSLKSTLNGRNTRVIRSGHGRTVMYSTATGELCVQLWNTTILRCKEDYVVLNTAGWNTITTRRRMNEYLRKAGLWVYSKDNFLRVMVGGDEYFYGTDMKIGFDSASNAYTVYYPWIPEQPAPKQRRKNMLTVAEAHKYAAKFVRQYEYEGGSRKDYCYECQREKKRGASAVDLRHVLFHAEMSEYPAALIYTAKDALEIDGASQELITAATTWLDNRRNDIFVDPDPIRAREGRDALEIALFKLARGKYRR